MLFRYQKRLTDHVLDGCEMNFLFVFKKHHFVLVCFGLGND
jgi:hypothetical protein